MASMEADKRMKALKKKLTQIQKLKEKQGKLTPEEAEKLSSEASILAELAGLENGEEVAHSSAGPPTNENSGGGVKEDPESEEGAGEQENSPAQPEVPPAEAEKRIRALKKKLVQITKLKERGGKYSAEEEEKLAAEPKLIYESTELEINLLDPENKKNAKSIQKKLDQIKKLQERKGQLSQQEKAKIAKDKPLKQELADILAARVPVKEPKEAEPDKKPEPEKQKAISPPVQKTAPVQKAAAAKETAPAPKPAPAPVPEPTPVQQEIVYDDTMASDSLVAAQWAFAEEDEAGEEDGFVEARWKTKMKKARAKAAAEAAAAEAEAAAAEKAKADAEAAAAAAEKAALEKAAAEKAAAEKAIADKAAADKAAAEKATADKAVAQAAEIVAAEKEAADKAAADKAAADKAAAEKAALEQEAADKAAAEQAEEAAKQAIKPEPVAATAEVQKSEPAPEQPPEKQSPEKRLKALKKKLAQITKLKEKGGTLLPEEQEKIDSEAAILGEISALEKGEPWPPVAPVQDSGHTEPKPVVASQKPQTKQAVQAEPEPVAPAAPQPPQPPQVAPDLEPSEAEKRKRNLKKKLAQIAKLRERGGEHLPEEETKLASEEALTEELRLLEKKYGK